MVGVHVVGVLVVVLTCVTLHAIAREVLEPRLVALPPLLYAVASTAAVAPDSLAVNGELLMNLPTALAVLAALHAARNDRGAAARLGLEVAAGAFVGCAALYKYQAALVGLSLVVLPLHGESGWRAKLRGLVSRGLALGLGLGIPLLVTALYFWRRGALHEAIQWGVAFNAHYLKEGPDLSGAARRLAMQLLGVVLPSLLVYGGGLYGLALCVPRGDPRARRARQSLLGVERGHALLVVWVLESIYSVTLGRRFFGHYFLQLTLVLSIVAAGPVARLWTRAPKSMVAALAAPALFFFVFAGLPGWSATYVYAVDPDYDALGRAVRRETEPSETIWVWGNVPQVYFAAERAPGVRFTFCNYLTGLSPGSRSENDPTYDSRSNAVPGAWDLVVHDLDANRPAVIVDTAAGGMKSYGKFPVRSFPTFAEYLAAHYRAVGTVDGAVLYRRTEPSLGSYGSVVSGGGGC